MKNIAVLIQSFTVEYSINILNGISSYFTDKENYRLIIGQTKNPNYKLGLYEYQYWAAEELLLSDEIDGIILISGSYSSTMKTKDLANRFKQIAKEKVIVSVGIDLGLEPSYYVHVNCNNCYKEIVEHLKHKHKCKNFAYLSADFNLSSESKERFTAFKNALKENDLVFDEKLVYQTLLTSSSAYEYFKKHFTQKDQVKFDALLATNDLMAQGVMKALKEIGINIPEDVKIIGFDDTSHAENATPSLTTINQNIFNQGFEASLLMDQLLSGNTQDKVREIEAYTVYRQSCGCIHAGDFAMNSRGQILITDPKQKTRYKSNGDYSNYLNELGSIALLMDMLKVTNSLQRFYNSLKYIMDTIDVSSMGICLYEKPISISRNDDIQIPDKVNLSIFVDGMNDVFEPKETFNPKKELLPEKYIKHLSGLFLIHPIFSGENNYGYIISSLRNESFSIYNLSLKLISNSVAQAYELTSSLNQNEQLSIQNQQLQQDKTDLSIQSKTDELTKILNRRGFMELAEKNMELAKEIGSNGLVIFMDMDGLKTINDNYGHKMGDSAIKAFATVIAKTFRANDIVGRLSGDEFAAVAVGLEKKHLKKIHDKIDNFCCEISKEKNFPFTLSCSMGATTFSSTKKNITKLLIEADKELYIEKRKKHKKQNS